jgi:hypothetical protein
MQLGMNASKKVKISSRDCFRRHPCGKSTAAMAFPRILPQAALPDQPENHDWDTRAGTSKELFRYGIVYFKKIFTVKPMPVPPNTGNVIHAGLLEVIS